MCPAAPQAACAASTPLNKNRTALAQITLGQVEAYEGFSVERLTLCTSPERTSDRSCLMILAITLSSSPRASSNALQSFINDQLQVKQVLLPWHRPQLNWPLRCWRAGAGALLCWCKCCRHECCYAAAARMGGYGFRGRI